jgi:hypothetical protein
MIGRLIGVATVVGALTAHAAPSAPAHVRGFDADSATGCLQKGEKAGTYTLATKDGKTYEVSSKSLKLDGHVGHTVTLTGDSKMGKDSKTWLDAKKMAMVSASCQ